MHQVLFCDKNICIFKSHSLYREHNVYEITLLFDLCSVLHGKKCPIYVVKRIKENVVKGIYG